MATSKQLKLALIGCGRYGLGAYAPAMARYAGEHPEQVELTAACDTGADRAQQACDQFGFAAACEDVAAMIRDHSPTACVLALPGDETLMQGSQLLVQSMPCLFETPLGDSLDEVMEMSDAAGEMNTPHMVALNRRVNPYLIRGIQWARQLGAIDAVTCTLTGPADHNAAYFGGTVAHAVDAIGTIMGRLDSFTLTADPGGIAIELHRADGAAGKIVLTRGGDRQSEAYEITGVGFGALATVEADDGPSLHCWRGDVQEVNIAGAANQPAGAADGTYDVLTAFIANLYAGAPLAPTIDDATAAMDLAYQIAAEAAQVAEA